MTTPIFDTIRCVAVPVGDLDRSKALFEQLGLTTSFDAELQPGFRWVELTAPSGGANLALVHAGGQLPAGIDTGIRLVTSNARSAHEAVHRAGLDAGDLLDWPTAPLMFSFTDLDGNRFYVSENEPNA